MRVILKVAMMSAICVMVLSRPALGSSGLITVGNDGGSYDYDNISDAVDAAGSFGSLIVVYPGTYAEGPIDFAGKTLVLRSNDGPEVTFLEPETTSRVVVIDSGESFGTELDGFTIQNGSAVGSGAGLLVANDSRVVVKDCVFKDNAAGERGGGVFVDIDSLAFISECTFDGNEAGTTGGGVDLAPTGGCTLERSRFFGNTAVDAGGGAHLGNGGALGVLDPPIILNCSFSGNRVTGEDGDGGGATVLVARTFSGSPPVQIGRGGAFGCTFVDNEANALPAISGGRDGKLPLSVAVVNCILDGNTGSLVSNTWIQPNWFHCCLDFLDSESAKDDSSIVLPPRFMSRLGEDGIAGTGDEDLRLKVGSPCIDSGYTYPPETSELNGALDLAGMTRVLDDPLSDDEGFGGPPVVDIGAYEFVIDDFDQFGVCWWTGAGTTGSLTDTNNWYEGLAAIAGRTWAIEEDVSVGLTQLVTTIGPIDLAQGSLTLDNAGGTSVKTIRIGATNFPTYIPANIEIGGFGFQANLNNDELVTLRCRDIDVNGFGGFGPRGDLELSGTFTNSGGLSLRSAGSISRVGFSTEPLLVNLGTIYMGSNDLNNVTIEGDFRQVGERSDGTESEGLLSLFLSGGSYDRLEVTGTATLGGGLDVLTESTSGTFTEGETITVVTAEGGFDGSSFDFVVTRGNILQDDLFFVQQVNEALEGGGGSSSDLLVVSGSSLLAGASQTEGVGLTLQDMILADIDGDGFDDLVLSVDSGAGLTGSVVVLLNQGTSGGTWDGFEAYSGGTFSVGVGTEPRGLDVGYVVEDDGSSRLDVVVTNYGDGTFTILTNSSTIGTVDLADTLGPIDSDPDFALNSFPLDVCVKDLDIDAGGLSDILVTNERDGAVWAFQNTSSLLGSSVGNAQKSEPPKPIRTFSPGRGGSGRDDDTTGSSSDDDGVSSGAAGAGLGAGIIMTWTGYDTPVGSKPSDLTVGDFDGDGISDIATANTDGSSISILLGTGAGAYSPATTLPLDSGYDLPVSLTAGDLDGDGDLDITYICRETTSGERVSKILRNTLALPGGAFGWVVEAANDLSGQTPYLVRARDLDNDGVDDVVTLTQTSSFAEGPTFGFSAPVADDTDGCIGDFNGDGSVGGDDLARILGAWGTNDPEIELSGDSVIDGTDLALLLGSWGACDEGDLPLD